MSYKDESKANGAGWVQFGLISSLFDFLTFGALRRRRGRLVLHDAGERVAGVTEAVTCHPVAIDRRQGKVPARPYTSLGGVALHA